MIIKGKVTCIITLLSFYLFENLEQFWFSLCFCQKLRSYAGLVILGKFYLKKVHLTTLLFGNDENII